MPQNLDSKYSIEILDPSGLTIAEFSGRAKNRSLRFVRNGTYEAEWSIDIDALEQYARTINVNAKSIFSVGQNQVRIKRIGVNLFGGQIAYYESDIDEAKELTVRAVGWLDLFENRFTSAEREFAAGTDIGSMAWTLINENQSLANGSYGITQGTLQDCPNLAAALVYEYKPIKEAIQQLSERNNGFDFEFTPDKKFNVYYPRMGVQRSEFEFNYPGNISKLKVSTDSTQLLNYAVVRGQGFGDGQIIDVRQDADSQNTYKLRQAILDYSDIPDVATLQALGDEDIRTRKNPLEIVEITLDGNREPAIGSYWLGDTVRVVVSKLKLYEHINEFYKIEEINITIDENDSEVVDLKLIK